jgi:hypothetical protein
VLDARGFTKLVVSIDGKKVRTAKKRVGANAKAIKIDPRKLAAGRHKVAIKLTGKGQKAKTERFAFKRCSTACVRGRKLALGHLPKPAGSTLALAVVRVSGRKAVKFEGAKANGRVSVRIPKSGSFRVTITVTTTDGVTRVYKRKFTNCGKKRRH